MRSTSVVAALCAASVLSGCAFTIEQTTYIQDAEIAGPVQQVPVHISAPNATHAMTVSPSFSYVSVSEMTRRVGEHTKVNSLGYFQVDTIQTPEGGYYFKESPGANTRGFIGPNVSWNPSMPVFGIDVDFSSQSFGGALGLKFGTADGSSYLGGTASLALLAATKDAGFRLEGGLLWQQMSHRIQSVVSTEYRLEPWGATTSGIALYDDTESETSLSWFASLTFNIELGLPVNLFFQGGLTEQKLFDYTPSRTVTYPMLLPIIALEDTKHVTASSTIALLTPGVYVPLSDGVRLVTGVRFPLFLDGEEVENDGGGIIPFVQVDFVIPQAK